MLSTIKKLSGATQNLLMGGNMTMDVRASMVGHSHRDKECIWECI